MNFNFNNFGAATVKNPVFGKFDKSAALFYTQELKSGVKRTAFMMINYPDCKNKDTVKLPKHFHKEIDLNGFLFLNNPYPASRADEDMLFRISDSSNLKILNAKTKEEISNDVDYDPSKTTLRFISESKDGNYSVEFTSTRNDELEQRNG